MPKIIENIRERAIEEARNELLRNGYTALTVRGIAAKLGIGLGTFYNYFPSKEYLAAAVMLEDWQQLTGEFETGLAGQSPEAVFFGLFDLVRTFSGRYVPAWKEYEQHGSGRAMIGRYHGTLVEQLAGYLRTAIPAGQQEREPWLAEFLAELILRFAPDSSVRRETLEDAAAKLLKTNTSAGRP